MTDALCPHCAKAVLPGAAEGLCPHCLWRALFSKEERAASLAEDPPLIGQFGDYVLLEEVARGGMGIVYRARQTSPARTVALKMILARRLPGEAEARRFRAEAEAAASLHHPNIVPIYEVGEVDGRAFFTMKFVAAGNLGEWLTRSGEAPKEMGAKALEARVSLMVKVARAVHHAHQRGILHRDLKPSNILLDEFCEPLVTDFGLAKNLDGESDLTLSGAVVGTPAYLSPEQALGEKSLTTAADVHSLGAILYELLTGRCAFQGQNALDTLRKVTNLDPLPPQAVNPNIDQDLQAICLTCLRKNPLSRYPSAAALAEDLERWLRKEAIQARPISGFEQIRNWSRRHPARAAAVLFGFLAPTIILAALMMANRGIRTAQALTRLNLYAADMFTASRALHEGNLGLARATLAAYIPGSAQEPDLRGFEWRWLWSQAEGAPHKVLTGFPQPPTALAVSPDGRSLAIAGQGYLWRWSADEAAGTQLLPAKESRWLNPGQAAELLAKVRLSPIHPSQKVDEPFEGAQLSRIVNPERPDTTTRISFSFDGKSVMTSTRRQGRAARVWSFEDGSIEFAFPASLSDAALSPVGRVAAVGTFFGVSATGCVKLYDLDRCQEIWAITNAGGLVAFSGDGALLATADWDERRAAGRIAVWSVKERALLRQSHSLNIWTSIAFSPDGRTVALARFDDPVIILYNWEDEHKSSQLIDHVGGVMDVSFSADGQWLASGGVDQVLRLWSVPSRTLARKFSGHADKISSVAFFPDAKRLASASRDGTVRIWERAREEEKFGLLEGGLAIDRLIVSPDGSLYTFGVIQTNAAFWSAEDYKPLRFGPAEKPLRIEGFAKDGQFVACSIFSPDEQITFQWRPTSNLQSVARSRPLAGTLPKDRLPVTAFSPAAELFAAGLSDGLIRIWSTMTGEIVREFGVPDHLDGYPRLTNFISRVAFSPDGSLLAASVHERSQIAVFSVPQDRLLHSGHTQPLTPIYGKQQDPGEIIFLAFSPDGETLASADVTERGIRLYEARTGRSRGTLAGHLGCAKELAFSPDGRTLASSGADGSTKLWHLPTLREMVTLLHTGASGSLGFSQNATVLAVGTTNGVKVFRAPRSPM